MFYNECVDFITRADNLLRVRYSNKRAKAVGSASVRQAVVDTDMT